MDPVAIEGWLTLFSMAAQLGVKTWSALKGLASDAALDDAQIAILQEKWTSLYDDVKRAAGE